MAKTRRTFREGVLRRVPGANALVAFFARLAAHRRGGIPVGLLALLPVALVIDLVDFADELGGPLGMALAFVLEGAFLLGVTGRTGYAFGFAGMDLVPGIDVIPFATITLLAEIARAWGRAPATQAPVAGRVVDVERA